MIEARGLVKRYRSTLAVDNLSFDVRPGTVTGFLGPNGAGKSTTMRMIMGLDRPDAGQVRIGGKRYGDLRWPLREVGALLEAKAFHPGRTARAHLTALAASNAIGRRRVEEVLAITGIEKAADRRAGKFSLGMSQRLGIAAALLGDPGVLLLDEPVNGLDPEGIRWIRTLLQEPRRPGPDGAGLQPPDQRDGAHRGRAHRDRPGPAARADHGRPAVRPRRLAGRSVLPADRRRHRLLEGACHDHHDAQPPRRRPRPRRLRIPHRRRDGVAQAPHGPLHLVHRGHLRGQHDRPGHARAEPRGLRADVRRRPRVLRPDPRLLHRAGARPVADRHPRRARDHVASSPPG